MAYFDRSYQFENFADPSLAEFARSVACASKNPR
jgi:hypothetical protein